MYFKKGRHRAVFIFPLLAIAIKIPMMRLFKTTKIVLRRLVHLDFKMMHRETTRSLDCGGYKDMLFGGIVTNWREFVFFRKTKNPFLQPTHFSFFGIFNIQKMGEPCSIDSYDLIHQVCLITNYKVAVVDDCHHFSNSENFCLDDGKLKILDYGSRKTHEVIIEYGTKIFELFDPSIDYTKIEREKVAKKT